MAKSARSGKAPARKTLLPPDGPEEATIRAEGHELKFTHLDKVYWPKEKIIKRDLLNYYDAMASYILPYLKERPQSLNRHPNGINGASFYQKNVEGKVADWLKTFDYESGSEGSIEWLVCTGEASLLYMANLGCIEMNPWHSRISSPDKPDWCMIDLDPDGNPFSQVIEVALVVHKVLDELKVPGYCKTSGATGMHIYIPLGAKYSYDQSRMLARLIVGVVHTRISGITSLERTPAKRKKKIYLDFLQNRNIQTIAAPYSVRPKPGATVSTPLEWEELKPGLLPAKFTIFNILDRVKSEGDIFKPVLGKGINLDKVVKALEAYAGDSGDTGNSDE